MKAIYLSIGFSIIVSILACGQSSDNNKSTETMTDKKYNSLTKEEQAVILHKATEAPFTGKYDKFYEPGMYACKQCGQELYSSEAKFKSGCGWPSFDDIVPGSVKEIPDADGRRTEIVCSNCGGHLGHVFRGERFTEKNTRHCVNSISLQFIPENAKKVDTAIFASGCFWGTEYHLQKAKGVLSTAVGYTGGYVEDPSYEQVCSGTTGHAEATLVIFDPTQTDFETLAKLFFETHDPTQVNRQGPDIGEQYRSEIFYKNEQQKEISEKLIAQLVSKGYKVATKLTKASEFYDAEEYHQSYYKKKNGSPYCHIYTERF